MEAIRGSIFLIDSKVKQGRVRNTYGGLIETPREVSDYEWVTYPPPQNLGFDSRARAGSHWKAIEVRGDAWGEHGDG